MVVFLEGSPISTEELQSSVRVTIGFLVTSLVATSRKSLGGSKRLPFKNDGGHSVLGDLQCCRNVLVHTPRSVPRPHGLIFALTCTVNCGTLNRQVNAFPNHVQSNEFTTGGIQSSCRNIPRMINGNRIHLILSLIAKDLNTYVNKVFLILQNNIFAWSL